MRGEVGRQERGLSAADAVVPVEGERTRAALQLERAETRVRAVHGRVVFEEQATNPARRVVDGRAPSHVEAAMHGLLDLERAPRLREAIKVPGARGLRLVYDVVAHRIALAREPPAGHVARRVLGGALAVRRRETRRCGAPTDAVAARVEAGVVDALPPGSDEAVGAPRAHGVALLVGADDAISADVGAHATRKEDVLRAS